MSFFRRMVLTPVFFMAAVKSSALATGVYSQPARVRLSVTVSLVKFHFVPSALYQPSKVWPAGTVRVGAVAVSPDCTTWVA